MRSDAPVAADAEVEIEIVVEFAADAVPASAISPHSRAFARTDAALQLMVSAAAWLRRHPAEQAQCELPLVCPRKN